MRLFTVDYIKNLNSGVSLVDIKSRKAIVVNSNGSDSVRVPDSLLDRIRKFIPSISGGVLLEFNIII